MLELAVKIMIWNKKTWIKYMCTLLIMQYKKIQITMESLKMETKSLYLNSQ